MRTKTSARYQLCWIDEAQQGEISGPCFDSLEEAEGSAMEFAAELLEHSGSEGERDAILAGTLACTDPVSGALWFADDVSR